MLGRHCAVFNHLGIVKMVMDMLTLLQWFWDRGFNVKALLWNAVR